MKERRPLHRDRVVRVVGENEHRSVIGRLVAHHPRQFTFHGPRTGPNMLRPITYAPQGFMSSLRARASASWMGSSVPVVELQVADASGLSPL